MIVIIMKFQVPKMIIVYNNIHRIINLLVITNVNIIVMIEQKKILYRTDYNTEKLENMAVLIVKYEQRTLKVQILLFGNEHQYRGKSNSFF